MNRNKKSSWYKPIIAVAAFAFVVGISGVSYNQWRVQNTVNSVVMLDVNPSITINVNKKERVLSVVPQNEDGKIILGDMDFKNTDLDVVVNALVGSMLQNGYLSDIQNAILVSVENNDTAKSAELKEKLSNYINSMLNNNQFESAVYSQSVSADSDIKQLAKTYNISEGKVALIKEVIAQDNTLTFEALAPMSVHEIALIMNSKHIDAKAVTQTGEASEKGYLSHDKLKEIVYAHAKVSKEDVSNLEIEFDVEDGIMVYEIEFNVGTTEYEYDVHAVTGEIVKFTKEEDSSSVNNSNKPIVSSALIGEDKAKSAAFSHAKVTESQVSNLEIKLDKEDNLSVYEIEFIANNIKYEYEINALDGSVIEHESEAKKTETKKNDTSDKKNTTNPSSNKSNYIGKVKARTLAFEHAKVTVQDARKMKVEFDVEDNVAVYEVEFETKDNEYEYTINATDGTVIDYEIEPVTSKVTGNNIIIKPESNSQGKKVKDIKDKDDDIYEDYQDDDDDDKDDDKDNKKDDDDDDQD